MRAAPPRRAVRPHPGYRFITPASPEFGCATLLNLQATTASGPWVSANDPVAVPFALSEAAVVAALGWLNGSSAAGNVDIGVYSTSWARLVSAGSTAGSGNSAWQWVNVTDTALAAGRYYLVMSRDNTTANRQTFYATTAAVGLMHLVGLYDSATNAFALPDPLTNMAAATVATRVPVMAMHMTRAQF